MFSKYVIINSRGEVKKMGVIMVLKKLIADHRESTGFTLIELVVVIIIIGILASIALPQYGKMVERTRLSEAISMLGTIHRAEMRYALEHDEYTTNFTNLDINVTLLNIYSAVTPYFSYVVNPASIYNDGVDDGLLQATRNGYRVGGGYFDNYVVWMSEAGNFSCFTGPGSCPPLPNQ